MGFLTGKPQKSESGNKAWPWAKDSFGVPGADSYGGSVNMLGDLLGLGGSGQSAEALDNYWKSTGGQFQLDQGLDSLNSKFASMGLSKSGAAMKGMEEYRQNLADTYLNNYMSRLSDLGKLGLGGGDLAVNAGQWSKGTGAKEGLGQTLGQIATMVAMASDRRLKTNIEEIGLWDGKDALKRYRYAYKRAPGIVLEGVMADEVKALRPHAYIPNWQNSGFDAVNYAAL